MVSQLKSIVDGLHERVSVDTVYGEPVETNGRTIIPVSKVAYGFGGGYGSNRKPEATDDSYSNRESDECGGGFGGGMIAKPIGVVEVGDTGTAFVRPDDSPRKISIIVGCVLIGYVLGRYR